ncbi:hypothetical protein PINS_up008237 [Pythium insidiosum]|nr:hypothetical protein PINS_up008237 [Pythium insidiosum]
MSSSNNSKASDEKPPALRDPRIPKFPVVFERPTTEQVTQNISQRDVLHSAALSVACFPLGYLLTRQIDPRMALRGMWFTGIVGTIGGCLLAYQNAELRLQGFGKNDEEVARYLGTKTAPSDDATTAPTTHPRRSKAMPSI